MRYIILFLFFAFSALTIKAQNTDCSKNISKTSATAFFQLTLDSLPMTMFLNDIKQKKYSHCNIDDRLQYVTKSSNQLVFITSFYSYCADSYKYYYPPTDYKYYLPLNKIPSIKFNKIDESFVVSPDDIEDMTDRIISDIKINFREDKFNYFFAGNNKGGQPIKEKYRNYGSPWIFNSEGNPIGSIHSFSGNCSWTGHTNCEKIDYAEIKLFSWPEDSVKYTRLIDIPNNSILPIDEGIVYFKKELVDSVRLEVCDIIKTMCQYAKLNNGRLEIGLY